MNHTKLLVSFFAFVFSASLCRAATVYPVNDGFEVPDLGAGGYAYGDHDPYGFMGLPEFSPATPGLGWTFTGTAGIAANGSGFGVTGATNVNENGGATSTSGQAGFIQNGYGNPNSIYQTLSGYPGGPTTVNFSLELRGGDDPTTGVDVKINGIDLGTYSTASTSSFVTITTPVTYIAPGSSSYTLTFTGVDGLNGQDNTDFIDNVQINTVPEPTSAVALCGLGAMGLFVIVRRRRKKS
jgi:hypothetical protein